MDAAFAPFDEAAGEAWRAWDEPMVVHVANSAPVRDRPLQAVVARSVAVSSHSQVIAALLQRWIVPPRAAPPALLACHAG